MILKKLALFVGVMCALWTPSLAAESKHPQNTAPQITRHQQETSTLRDLAALAGYPVTVAAAVAVPALMICASDPESTAATIAVAAQLGYAVISPIANTWLSIYMADHLKTQHIAGGVLATTTSLLTLGRNILGRGPLGAIAASASLAYYFTGNQTARGIAIGASAASGALNIIGTTTFYFCYGALSS